MPPVSLSVSDAGTRNLVTAVSSTANATKANCEIGVALAMRLLVVSTFSDLHQGGISGGNFSDSQSNGFVVK